jgi:hypothetical protein
VPWPKCQTLGEAILDLQGHIVGALDPQWPRLVLGDGPAAPVDSPFAVRATFDGWVGGVVPAEEGRRLPERQECVPAGVLAAGLAVSEAFQFIRGSNATAGRRDVGLSLWCPDSQARWLDDLDRGPVIERLPSKLWLIGLGHLGQAILWTLGLLPYAEPHKVELVLQDFDALTPANDSTSLLTNKSLVGHKKTRAMAEWCEEHGFRATINERKFAANFQVEPDEPGVALCGVDNALARAALEEVGFERIVEAGLGAGPQDYLAFQVHTFPAVVSARQRWGGSDEVPDVRPVIDRPAYRALSEAGVDECGLVTLAGRTVGAPFVGAATAALVMSEVLRMIHGDVRYAVIDGSLRSFEHLQAVRSEPDYPFNPGTTPAW